MQVGTIKVKQMKSKKSGASVNNQFIIYTEQGKYFQSYESTIVFVPNIGPIQLGPDWNASRTTSKYRSLFLYETTVETRKKLLDGTYILNNEL